MYRLYVRHWFMAIPDPEVRSSGRVNMGHLLSLRIEGGRCIYAYNVVWITAAQDRAN